MSTAGLQVFNDGGSVQVDQNYINLALVAKGSASLTADASWVVSPVVSATISYTGTNPVLALNSANPVCVCRVTVSGSTWTWYVICHQSTGFSLDYYIFDNPPTPTETGGLEVFNATGVRVFQSSQKYLRIVGGMGTYTSGRTYATIQSGSGNNYQVSAILHPPPDWRVQNKFDCSSVASNVTSSSTVIFENYTTTGSAPLGWTSPAGQFLTVDVTNY